MPLEISKRVHIPDSEIELDAVRAAGAGGQNVNKSSTAVHLRFDIGASSLPDYYKERLLTLRDRRITQEGVVVIKAQQHRTQEQNRGEALTRLRDLIRSAVATPKARRPTQPSRAARQQRIEGKKRRGQVKTLRQKVNPPGE